MAYWGDEAEGRAAAQNRFNAWATEGMRRRNAAEAQADANKAQQGRLNRLRAALRDMLSVDPDVWDGGFDVDAAAAAALPVIEAFVRGRG